MRRIHFICFLLRWSGSHIWMRPSFRSESVCRFVHFIVNENKCWWSLCLSFGLLSSIVVVVVVFQHRIVVLISQCSILISITACILYVCLCTPVTEYYSQHSESEKWPTKRRCILSALFLVFSCARTHLQTQRPLARTTYVFSDALYFRK